MLALCFTRRLAIASLLVVFMAGFAGRAGAQVFDQLGQLKDLENNRSKHYTQLSKLKNGRRSRTRTTRATRMRLRPRPGSWCTASRSRRSTAIQAKGIQKYQDEFIRLHQPV